MALPASPRTSGPHTLSAGQTGPVPFGWRLFEAADLAVYRRRAGEEEVLALGVDYSIAGVGAVNGGSVSLLAGALEGDQIFLAGERDVARKATITSERGTTPTLLNYDLDLTFAQVQEIRRDVTRAFRTSFFTPDVFDLEDRRLGNVGAPVDPQDAVTKGYGDANYGGAAAETAVAAAEQATTAASLAVAAASAIAIATCATRAALSALDPAQYQTAVLREAGREGTFAWRAGDYSAQISADTAGGLYLKADSVAASAGAWVRVYDGPVLASWFGVSAASADNTAAYDALTAIVPSGTSLLFPPNATLLGHFVTSKGYKIDLAGSTLVNVLDNAFILQMGSLSLTAHTVTEATLVHGARTFTVTGASGLFAAGEIGYLWDSAVRPGDGQAVNFECIKIASVAGDVVTVEGFLRSYKGAGAIKFYHSPDQIRDAALSNGFAAPTATHALPVLAIWNCHGVTARGLSVTGGNGNGLSVRYSYDTDIDDFELLHPVSVGSGQGYGVAVVGCTRHRANNIRAIGARHAYDQDSVYDFEISNVSDPSPASSPCIVAHNGFAAYGSVTGVSARVADYLTNHSAQGFGTGPGNALRQNHPAREIYYDDCHQVVPASADPNASSVMIYIQSDVSGGVRDCTLRFEDVTTPISNTSQSRLLRVSGVMVGEFHVESLAANRVGSLFFADNYANGPAGVGAAYIRNLVCGDTRTPIWVRGDWGVDVDCLTLGSVAGDQLVLMDTLNGDAPLYAAMGASIRYNGVDFGGTDREFIRTSTPPPGRKVPSAKRTGNSISVVADAALTLTQVQNRDAALAVLAPSGAGTCTLSATDALPAPQINGAELHIRTFTGRNDVAFPAGNNINSAFTITAGRAAHLLAIAGKWVPLLY